MRVISYCFGHAAGKTLAMDRFACGTAGAPSPVMLRVEGVPFLTGLCYTRCCIAEREVPYYKN